MVKSDDAVDRSSHVDTVEMAASYAEGVCPVSAECAVEEAVESSPVCPNLLRACTKSSKLGVAVWVVNAGATTECGNNSKENNQPHSRQIKWPQFGSIVAAWISGIPQQPRGPPTSDTYLSSTVVTPGAAEGPIEPSLALSMGYTTTAGYPPGPEGDMVKIPEAAT